MKLKHPDSLISLLFILLLASICFGVKMWSDNGKLKREIAKYTDKEKPKKYSDSSLFYFDLDSLIPKDAKIDSACLQIIINRNKVELP